MESIIFWTIVKIVVTQTVLKTGDNRLKMFDMIEFILPKVIYVILIGFFGIQEEVGDLFPELRSNLHLCYSSCFGLE